MIASAALADRPMVNACPAFDADAARRDFPILATPVVHGRAFLDSAASAQKPIQVIDAVRRWVIRP